MTQMATERNISFGCGDVPELHAIVAFVLLIVFVAQWMFTITSAQHNLHMVPLSKWNSIHERISFR